jgi:type II secretory ATPase GspE/PulE/Tfp pilus assembly ATPase PilB-like protein
MMSTWLDSVKDKLEQSLWEKAREEEEAGKDPRDFILKGEYLESGVFLNSLSVFYDIPSILLDQYEPEDVAVAKIGEKEARRFGLMPLFILKENLFVAVSEPGNLDVEDYIRHKTGLTMVEIVTTGENIESAINRHYLSGERTAEKVKTISAKKPEVKASTPLEEIRLSSDESPSVQLTDHIISSAIRLGASDIHLEPLSDGVYLRYRIDGVLREYPPPPPDLLKAITSRMKILAELDVSEKRLPQDGRITFKVDSRDYDLRVSMIPNLYGESVVIRVLTSSSNVKELSDLGFSELMLKKYCRMILKPHGVLLVTGPTGSGKSTTLYATLRHVLTPEKKILSLEDPVEAQIRGVTQFQMNPAIGFTFARCLRSVLRHDPEIVLLGEIRDEETAEIAIRASLTGHMIFSTLHTNDAASAPTRLIDMGVPSYLVMASLVGVLAQRLVRRLCLKCRAPYHPDKEHLEAVGLHQLPAAAAPFRPVGCSACEHTGYKGRAAIYELLEISPEIRRLSGDDMTAVTIQQAAEKQGFVSLRQSGVEKWCSGLTSLEEVVKLTVE